MSKTAKLSRRNFLKATAGALVAPYFIPSTVLGKDGGVAPSNRLTVAHIGLGGQGSYHLRVLRSRKDVQIVALCDTDTRHLKRATEQLSEHYKSLDGILQTQNFLELLDHKDKYDTALIATPDHVHAINTLAMLRNGIDCYCEKPLTRTIVEGRAVADTVKQYGRVLQTGSHERSNRRSRYVADLVRNGYLGQIKRVEVNMPVTSHQPIPMQKVSDPPKELDYDLWLGPAPYVPYFYSDLVSPHRNNDHYQRCHFWFRYQSDYATGEMSDRGAHILDLVQMILDKDKSGPVEVSATGKHNDDSEFDTYMEYEFDIRYDDGVVVHGTSVGDDSTRGLKIIGDEGWINVHVHGCALTASDPRLLEIKLKPSDVSIGVPEGHHQDFFDAVKNRNDTIASAETGHRSASACHITTIAMRLGRPLHWDPKAERFINDDDANRLLHYTYRTPWTL